MPVLLITIDLVRRNIKLVIDPSPAHAKGLFLSSNLYLLILILAICLGTVIVSLVS